MTTEIAIKEILKNLPDDSARLFTTGNISKIAYNVNNIPNNFYMTGSMGLLHSIALGLTITKPELPVIVFDGDGSILMDLASILMIKEVNPKKFIHFVLDNECYESTGGQRSLSKEWLIANLAKNIYKNVYKISSKKRLAATLTKFLELEEHQCLIHVKCLDPNQINPQRIKLKGPEIAQQFSNFVMNL